MNSFCDCVSDWKNYLNAEYMTIDEMLGAFRGRTTFRQYMKNKPAKYGIKMLAFAYAHNYYNAKIEVQYKENNWMELMEMIVPSVL